MAVTEPRRSNNLSLFELLVREARDPSLIRKRGMGVLHKLRKSGDVSQFCFSEHAWGRNQWDRRTRGSG